MSYQVIARKYRPQRFSDVVGQEHVTRTLANAIRQNRIAHAYLFVGPRGTGKTTIARIFAKALNCTDGPNADFSADDSRCQEITEGRSLDVLEIDGASNRGIEEVRELRETVKYAPATSRFKIYIIDEVHMLTKEAFNALLKTLEEPPAHVKFMFATTEPEKILPTILSRCQRFDLRRIPVTLIVGHLGAIAKLEKVEIEDAALQAIARGADGGMRDAESALDQLISFCGNKIVENDVLSMFGLTARGQILLLSTAVMHGESELVLRELNELARHGKDLGRLLSDLLGHFRNLLVYKVSKGDLSLLEVSETEAASLAEQASAVDDDVLTRMMDVLTEAEGRFREAASKKIFLEVTLLKAIQTRKTVSIDSLIAHLTELQSGDLKSAKVPSLSPAAPVKSAPKPEASRVAFTAPAHETTVHPSVAAARPEGNGDGNLDQLWKNLLEAVGRASAFTRSYLLEAHPVSLAKGVLTIGFDPEFVDQLELVNNQRTHALLQTKLQELEHPNLQVKFVQAESPLKRMLPAAEAAAVTLPPVPSAPVTAPTNINPAPAAATPLPAGQPKAAPTAISMEEFKNDPLIKAALEIFKGQIVEVRA